MEIAGLIFEHVFRYFGIPEDIVSDRGTQFTSRVWKAFFKRLGVAYLPWAEYAQNSLRQQTTGLTPFQCVLGYQPPFFPWSDEPSDVRSVYHWFRESERVWNSAHHQLQGAVRRHEGCCHSSFIHSVLPSRSKGPGAEEVPPPTLEEDTGIYSVKETLDSRRRGGALQYLVDWEGYGPEERSWVPRDDILDPNLLWEFHESHPGRPAPRPRGRPPRRSGVPGPLERTVKGGGYCHGVTSHSSSRLPFASQQSALFPSPSPSGLQDYLPTSTSSSLGSCLSFPCVLPSVCVCVCACCNLVVLRTAQVRYICSRTLINFTLSLLTLAHGMCIITGV
ncbi:uncharacterized protein LOC113657297 [Tachysurus fulvidraco]|uniref:uncharacterized protein LOC113657297 n=1 Tax=Tachysurus fulvidraco TaxID=1234273 RepID=UPI001FEDD24E|nr:uncharacterized protein LOC113657297 [Tachysurus fulvidraco]